MERWTSAAIDFHGKRATCSFCIEQRSPFRTRTRKRCDRWSPQSLSNSSSMTATSHTHTHTLAIDWLFRFSLAQIGSDLNGLGGSGGGGGEWRDHSAQILQTEVSGSIIYFRDRYQRWVEDGYCRSDFLRPNDEGMMPPLGRRPVSKRRPFFYIMQYRSILAAPYLYVYRGLDST